jgi:Asp-tRNA(Asn)/Glu-tRNA(Gln) amidotransferase B subunit
MRDKKSDDYRYMTEPNIPAIDILNLINSTPLNQNELPKNIKQKLIDDGVNNDVITQLLEDYPLYKSFKYVSEHVEDQKSAIN